MRNFSTCQEPRRDTPLVHTAHCQMLRIDPWFIYTEAMDPWFIYTEANAH